MHAFLVLASLRAVGDASVMRMGRFIGSPVLVFAIAVWISSPHASAECASSRWAAHALTTLGASFPRTGGAILVAMDPDLTAGTLTSPEPPALNVTRGRRTSWPLTPVSIAPGLFRVPFDTHVTRGIWTLHGLGADTQLTIGVAATPGVPVRPAIREVRRVAATGIGVSGDRLEVRANLEFPVPDGVVASIVTWNTDASPGAWGRAAVGQREIVLYSERSACAALAPGWTPPPGGTLVVRVSWVDQYGQVSPPSDAITVQ
jgi:hypothetical protein